MGDYNDFFDGMMKADKDREVFVDLLSRFTKISKSKIKSALNNGNKVNDILQNPQLITDSQVKAQRIEDLKVLRNTYDNLKDYSHQYAINSPEAAAKFFINYNMDRQDKEYFSIAYLNTKMEVISVNTSEGAVDYVAVSTRELVKEALKVNARSVIVSHNHPSGNSTPSEADRKLTQQIDKALRTVEMNLADHIITANDEFTSIAEIRNEGSVSRHMLENQSNIGEKEVKYSIKDKLLKAEKEGKERTFRTHEKKEKEKLER